MEVHAHSHSSPASGGTARKKWTHYLWEFLMLFLAVFCGFLAENQREHMVEKHRARQYALSIIEDLKADTIQLNSDINNNQRSVFQVDTLLSELNKPASIRNDTLLHRLTARLPLNLNFGYNPQLSTYLQAKNSGSLRYFAIELIKKLNAYETNAVNIQKINNQTSEFTSLVLWPFVHQNTNGRFLRSLRGEINYDGPVFIEQPGEKLLQEWYNHASLVKNNDTYMIKRMTSQRTNATELITLIQKEYHLQ